MTVSSIITAKPVAESNAVGSRNFLTIVVAVSALLILAGFSIDLAAGRWGAYIRSPVPGIYLADLLFGLGAVGALIHVRRVFGLHPAVIGVFAVVGTYLAVRGFLSLVWDPVPDRYLAVRDLAPFGYLLLVPLVAVALRQVSWPVFIWVVRIAAVLHLLGYTLASWGVVTEFSSPLLGADFVPVFHYRADLIGVVFGIGFLAWGRWSGAASASRIAQFLFIAFGFDQGGRAAFVTFVFCLGAVVWRERSWWRLRYALPLVASGIIAAMTIGYVQDNWADIRERWSPEIVVVAPDLGVAEEEDREALPGDIAPAPDLHAQEEAREERVHRERLPEQQTRRDITADLVPDAIRRQAALGLTQGTSAARIDTWTRVLKALSQENLWVLGGGLGSDVLFRICSAAEPPAGTGLYAGGGSQRPKCRVDANEAPTILRDPHNWLLNSLLYHGVVGTVMFILAIAAPLWVYRRNRHSSLAIIAIAAYFVNGSFGVILSSPFGMLPVAVFLGWLLRDALLSHNGSGISSHPADRTA